MKKRNNSVSKGQPDIADLTRPSNSANLVPLPMPIPASDPFQNGRQTPQDRNMVLSHLKKVHNEVGSNSKNFQNTNSYITNLNNYDESAKSLNYLVGSQGKTGITHPHSESKQKKRSSVAIRVSGKINNTGIATSKPYKHKPSHPKNKKVTVKDLDDIFLP